MPTFDTEPETIPVFELDGEYVFSHYFNREDIFDELKDFYNGEKYRFEVPESEFDAVRDRLAEVYYDVEIISDPDSYIVVTEKYDKHAEILKMSVANWERDGHRFFIMKNELSVKQAVEKGATRIEETNFVSGI